MRNADHAPFYFSRKYRLASDADDPTATEVRNAGTPTGETGRKVEAEDDDNYGTPEGARKASMTQYDAKKGMDWKPKFGSRNK